MAKAHGAEDRFDLNVAAAGETVLTEGRRGSNHRRLGGSGCRGVFQSGRLAVARAGAIERWREDLALALNGGDKDLPSAICAIPGVARGLPLVSRWRMIEALASTLTSKGRRSASGSAAIASARKLKRGRVTKGGGDLTAHTESRRFDHRRYSRLRAAWRAAQMMPGMDRQRQSIGDDYYQE